MAFIQIVACARKSGDADAMFHSFPKYRSAWDSLWLSEQVGCRSMGEGYNRAIEVSVSPTPDVVIFTHTDIRVWAGTWLLDRLVELALMPNTGFVGLAGTQRLQNDALWWRSAGDQLGCVAHEQLGKMYSSSFGPYGNAVAMDGVFLAIARNKLNVLGKWPEDLGWHFYDIEMTVRATLAGYTNWVVPFPILHKSVGEVGPEWDRSRVKFLARYGSKLPLVEANQQNICYTD